MLGDKASLTMSGHFAKRRKITGMASPGVTSIDSLPPELLEATFGFLDVGTLCTARLVCAQFSGAASRFLHSVELSVKTLRSRPETTLQNFPNLNQVTVFSIAKNDLLILAQSPVGDAVTHLRAVEYLRPVPRHGRSAPHLSLLPLPNLVSLTVSYPNNRVFSFPQTLRELILDAPVTWQTANLVTGLTKLSCLRIDVQYMDKPFKAVTALTALQRLEICSHLSLIPSMAELTVLTHLHFQHATSQMASLDSDLAPLASLARLTGLVHLGFQHFGASLERDLLASVATFTSLRSLDLEFCPWERSAFETVCMTAFSQLTALRLISYGIGLDASFLPRFNLEGLQDLSLSRGVKLNRDGVAALRRATCLTHLHLCTATIGASVGFEELGIALSRMSRLRALSLGTPDAVHTTFSLRAIALLTELTRLELRGRAFIGNVEVCLGLKKLRILRVEVPFSPAAASDCIAPETFFALAKLPELREFSIWGNAGISREDLTDDVRAWLNAERHDRGWPPLELTVRVS